MTYPERVHPMGLCDGELGGGLGAVRVVGHQLAEPLGVEVGLHQPLYPAGIWGTFQKC